jgi:DNA helicase-2/ATP-dependent DNA helicase PcrA
LTIDKVPSRKRERKPSPGERENGPSFPGGETGETGTAAETGAIDYGALLNREQRAVVFAGDGPILVIAGAGSGKTRALTFRVARLLSEGVDPERILLATFTNKAARDMLSRVESVVPGDCGRIWGGTFHHLANRILRSWAHRLGYERSFTILDEDDSRHLVHRCLEDLGIAGEGGVRMDRTVRDCISYARNTGEPLSRVIRLRTAPRRDRLSPETLERVIERYGTRKREGNAMDFDDLLVNLRDLLVTVPEARDRYGEQFLHILVDEYQDTNAVQAEILDLLALKHGNLLVVGDDSQSIYSFRGANYENILRFPRRYPAAKVFKLETNYRSTPEILHMANLCITCADEGFRKELRPIKGSGVKPAFVPLRNPFQQALFVAQRIEELAGEGVPPGEMAVLYRAHHLSTELQMEMTKRGIPFDLRSGIRFTDQAHVRDVTAYLRILENPMDETAWRRILLLYRGIGKAGADRIWKRLAADGRPLDALLDPGFSGTVQKGAAGALTGLQALMAALLGGREGIPGPGRCITLILDGGYREYMRDAFPDPGAREEDLTRLARFASRFPDQASLLGELALMGGKDEETENMHREPSRDRVILGTIHQAKGLEWAVVFLAWCTEGMIPLSRAVQEEGGIEEERRLFYVAVTRAKDQLYLCHPAGDASRGGFRRAPLEPSRFIRELVPSSGRLETLPFEEWYVENGD